MQSARLGDVAIDLRKHSSKEIGRLKQVQGKVFVCPHCDGELILKAGEKNKAHFSHVAVCKYVFYEHESEQHLQTKMLFANWLMNQGVAAYVEHRFPEIMRIADVYFEHDDKKYVFEIQKSPLSEQAFNERSNNYLSLGVTPIWIFLGEVRARKHATILASVMTGKNQQKLLHFDLGENCVTFFDDIIWLTSKEVVATKRQISLEKLLLGGMIHPAKLSHSDIGSAWRDVKQRFRKRDWFYFSKTERRLSILCMRYGINMALLPSEIGWPVIGKGFKKPLFVWQAYIFMSVITEFSIGDFFNLGDMLRLLRRNFSCDVKLCGKSQLRAYLGWLIRFGILNFHDNSYEVIYVPVFLSSMEGLMQHDDELIEEFL